MAISPPTPKQRVCERFIARYIAEHDGVSPSLAEIGAALNLTEQGAGSLVQGLIKRGRLTKARWQARSIQLIEERRQA